jgi:GAF domain-containing protein/cytochrome c-type biogenesis protein CcmH/NrfG
MPDIEKLFEKAEKYLQKQKFDAALETYQEIYKYQPNEEEVLLNLGDLCLKLNRITEGVRFQSQLADLCVKRNDITKAVATCRKILKVAPKDATTLMKLGGLLEKTGKGSEALEAYREALELHRTAGAGAQVLECLQHIVKLDPTNLEAHVHLGEQAVRVRLPKVATAAFLQAAQLARKAGQDDRWAELVERAHELDPTDEAGAVAAAELFLKRERGAEAAVLLEPIAQQKPDDLTVVELLTRAYVQMADYTKAQPLCWRLYQARPETLDVVLKLVEGLLEAGAGDQALKLIGQLKGRLFQQGKRNEFLKILESIYQADEANLAVLEMLTGLYNELNKEDGLRRSLSRLFGLYLAGEQYDQAADTLDRIIDVDPYGPGHYDRLLTLEGHIDRIWYDNIASRLQPPSTVARGAASSAAGPGQAPGLTKSEALDDLIIEGEMYNQYQLASKLRETLAKINQLYPGAEEKNPRLRELYSATGFMPTGAPPATPATAEPAAAVREVPVVPAVPSQQSLEDLRRISEITAHIYRESTPEGVMRIAANEIGRALNASRCWGALGAPDLPPSLTVEYCSPATQSSDVAPALSLYGVLIRQAASKPDGWMMENVTQFPVLTPIMPDVQKLRIQSLLSLPLMDKDQPAGLLLVEQCDRRRVWTPSETILLQAIATQVVIAVNNSKLRRLVRSIAGSDQATGLLPRSAYVDCLLSEAARAKETSQPLSLCLLEPENPSALVKAIGDAGVQRHLLQVAKAVQANLRENDIAIRYSPCAIAVVFPDTPLAQGGLAVDKLRRVIAQMKLDGASPPNFCCAVCEVPLGLHFDVVDGVTEVINRLEAVLDQARKEGGRRVLLSKSES